MELSLPATATPAEVRDATAKLLDHLAKKNSEYVSITVGKRLAAEYTAIATALHAAADTVREIKFI